MPHSMRKMPRVTRANGISLKTARSGVTLFKLVIGVRGNRLLTSRFMITSKTNRINPKILVAHANPTVGNSFWSINGNMIPPIEPAVIATPVAFPRLARNQCPIEAMQGVLMRQPPIPFRTLYTMMKCQYS